MQLGEGRLLPELDGWELQCRYPRRRPSRPQRGLKCRHRAQGRRRVGSAWPGRPRAGSNEEPGRGVGHARGVTAAAQGRPWARTTAAARPAVSKEPRRGVGHGRGRLPPRGPPRVRSRGTGQAMGGVRRLPCVPTRARSRGAPQVAGRLRPTGRGWVRSGEAEQPAAGAHRKGQRRMDRLGDPNGEGVCWQG